MKRLHPRALRATFLIFVLGISLFGCQAGKDVSVRSGDYRFVWEPADGQYSARVLEGNRAIATLPTPFTFHIATGDRRETCSGSAEAVESLGTGAIAKGKLKCPNGARLYATLQVEPQPEQPAGFLLHLRTEVISARGDGIAQSLRFSLPGDPEADALIPGVWYKRNEHVEDCVPSLSGGDNLHVREDRATYPAVTIRSGKRSLSLFREAPARFDALPAHDGSEAELLFAGNALYTAAQGGTDIAGIGFDLSPGAPAISMHYPFYEGPYSMQLKVYAAEATPLFDPYCRYQAVQGVLDWKLAHEGGLATTWRLVPSAHEDFGELLSSHATWAFQLYSPAPHHAVPDSATLRNALAGFVASHYDHSSDLAGFFYVMTVPGARVLLPYFEPGFTGRAFLNARLLLEAGRETGNAAWVTMATSVYDTWITAGTHGGYFYDLWDAKRNVATSEHELNALPDGFALRREAEALWALLDAVRDEEARGFTHSAWRDAARAHLDGLLGLAQKDGSFCRRYTFERKCLDSNPGGTSAAIPALVHGYRLFGDSRYLAAAVNASRFVAEHFIKPADYYASTIDNPSENKEAATYAFYAARLMCEERCSDEPEWLTLAQQAADAALTWIKMTDVPFYAPTMLAEIGLETRGLGNVAAGGGNVDAYAFEFPGSLAWLAEQTGDARYAAMAKVILSAAMGTVAVEGNMRGLAEVGMAPEGFQQTLFSYFMGGKGSYAPFSALGWTTANIYQAMDEVERVTGVQAAEYLENP